MEINTDADRIEEILTRGVEEIIDKGHLKKELFSGRKLRIKHGVDPTGPKIHIGRATQLWKLKAFQDLGHQIVLIIGDFTAQIGDASDKQEMRRSLSAEEIKENMKDYLPQIYKILDAKKTEVHYNSEWLDKLSAKDLLSLSANFTAQQMIQRRNFKERWDGGTPIGLYELNYPLFQGYDSVAVKADLEIGGFDQLFNLKAGRDIQRAFKQEPQDIMALKMLFGLDGRKMSTSWGNIIAIVDNPKDMYGKLMSMKDELIIDYFELCAEISLPEIEKIKEQLKDKKVNPRDIKARLAFEIVKMYHGEKEAREAGEEFSKIFTEKQIPSDIPNCKLKASSYKLLDLLVETKIASSKAEARRLIEQGGVKIDGQIQNDWQEIVETPARGRSSSGRKEGMILQSGKRKFVKLV